MPDPVIKTIEVPCSPEIAFRIFTSNLNAWWPLDKNTVSAMGGKIARAVTLEPREGGILTETGHDGTTHHWGSVKTWDPFSRLSLMWHINKPAAEATIVDIVFEPRPDGSRVTLTHQGWEALGDAAQNMRDGYDSGWVSVFETAFADACRQKAA